MYQGYPSKVLVHNIEAEQSVIVSILANNKNLENCKHLSPDDFYPKKHQIIFRCIRELCDKDIEVDLVSLAQALEEKQELERIGGAAYLAKIADYAPISLNMGEHARIIKECSLKRKISILGSRLADGSDQSIEDILNFCHAELGKIQPPRQKIAIISAAQIREKNPQQTPLINGFLNQGEGLIVHAAGGVGKSMFSLFLACQAAARNPEPLFDEFQIQKRMQSLFIQSENSMAAINTRLLGMTRGPDEQNILESLFFPQIYDDVLMTGKTFEDPVFIQHCVDMIKTVEDQTSQSLDLFVVDPLISFHNGDENDAGRMRAALDGITQIAQRTNITPVVLHHNNRNDDYRGSSAVYDWARNMISLKRVFIGQDRIIAFNGNEPIKRTAKIPAIEVNHEKANNLPLFEKFTICMDQNFKFSRVADAVSPEVQERCMEVAQALQDLGGFAKSNLDLAKAVSELTGRGTTTCKKDISEAVKHEFITAEKSKGGSTNAYCYTL